MPLPRPTAKYCHLGPLTLARMTHEVEGVDDMIRRRTKPETPARWRGHQRRVKT